MNPYCRLQGLVGCSSTASPSTANFRAKLARVSHEEAASSALYSTHAIPPPSPAEAPTADKASFRTRAKRRRAKKRRDSTANRR